SQAFILTAPPIPQDQLRSVIGDTLPDLYVAQGYISDQQIWWRNVIGPETGGRIAPRILMSELGQPGVVLSMYEITTSTQGGRILERGDKVATWAAATRALGLPVKAALVIDRGAYFGLSTAERERLVTTVTSAGGYIFTVQDFTSGAIRNARIFE